MSTMYDAQYPRKKNLVDPSVRSIELSIKICKAGKARCQKLFCRVRTGPGKPGKSWNFVF